MNLKRKKRYRTVPIHGLRLCDKSIEAAPDTGARNCGKVAAHPTAPVAMLARDRRYAADAAARATKARRRRWGDLRSQAGRRIIEPKWVPAALVREIRVYAKSRSALSSCTSTCVAVACFARRLPRLRVGSA